VRELYQKLDNNQENFDRKKTIEERFAELDEPEFYVKKYNSFVIFELYQHFASKKKLQRLADCGTYLGFDLFKHIQKNDTYTKKLANANFCRDRFCEMCNWRRARKYAIENFCLLKAIEQRYKVRYIFATFTIKNPLISDLRANIKLFNQAWRRMVKTKRWINSILGYIKAIEIPFQKTDNNRINLHSHCLLIVPTTYFNKNCNLYIKQQEFKEMWQKALRIDYQPSVDIRIIKKNENRDSDDAIASVVAETTKYPLKSIDLNNISWQKFKILVEQTKYLNFVAYGGIARDMRVELFGSDEFTDDDLISNVCEKFDESIWQKIGKLWYQLDAGKYKLHSFERIENE